MNDGENLIMVSSRLTARTRLPRLVGGVALIVAIFVAAAALLPGWIHTWGATPEEVARAMPGDDRLSASLVSWTHGITIDAPPEQVWPWIAQLGDDRGGFYSYTFVENLFAGEDLYNNANEILPQFQDPQPGEGLIVDYLLVSEVQPGNSLLAEFNSEMPGVSGVAWIWVWQLLPQGEDQTRLLVRMGIEVPPPVNNPLVTWVIDAGGFVMERRMMVGIKDRAEGRTDPPYGEAVEIVLWLAALAAGLTAAVLFLTRHPWQRSLAVGVAALLALIWFTWWQPPVGVRVVVDGALWLGVWWAARQQGSA
jgi:hypothetical protein